MPSPGHTRVNRLSEGDVVSIGVGDHQCLHLVARRLFAGVDAELVEVRNLILDAAYSTLAALMTVVKPARFHI